MAEDAKPTRKPEDAGESPPAETDAGGPPDAPPSSKERELAELEAEADMGVHLPGLFPEQDVVHVADEHLNENDRRILADLREAVGEDDAAAPDAPEAPGAAPPPAAPPDGQPAPPRGAALPWWYAIVYLGPATLFVFAIDGLPDTPPEWAFLALALLAGWAVVKAIQRGRARRR